MPWRRKNLPASPDPAEQVEELLPGPADGGGTGIPAGDGHRPSVRSQDAPEPSGAKRVRQGKTAPDEQDLIPEPEPEELSLPEQRRQTAREFFGAMFLDPDPAGRGIRGSAGGGELPSGGNGQPAHPGIFRPAHRGGDRVHRQGKLPPTRNRQPGWPGWQTVWSPSCCPGACGSQSGRCWAEGSCWTGCDPFPRFHTKKTG